MRAFVLSVPFAYLHPAEVSISTGGILVLKRPDRELSTALLVRASGAGKSLLSIALVSDGRLLSVALSCRRLLPNALVSAPSPANADDAVVSA